MFAENRMVKQGMRREERGSAGAAMRCGGRRAISRSRRASSSATSFSRASAAAPNRWTVPWSTVGSVSNIPLFCADTGGGYGGYGYRSQVRAVFIVAQE